jgi:hypothetical protein
MNTEKLKRLQAAGWKAGSAKDFLQPTIDTKAIKTKADYRAILKEVESLMGAKANTADGERLDALVKLVEAYEKKHCTSVTDTPLTLEQRLARFDPARHGGETSI